MIVETNREMRNLLRHAFEHRGYLTWTCPSLEIAACVYEAIHPDVVLLDLDFEGLDCVTFLEMWHRESPKTKIIVESASNNKDRIDLAMEHGAHAFLQKPYSLPPLFELLEKQAA
jgi:DNA-binding NtrC family response regulator